MIRMILRIRLFYCFSALIFMSILGHADEVLNLESLPTLRTKLYPLNPYKKIVVFSAPRTGSSLTYNVVRLLFQNESSILSRHDDWNQDCFVLRTHRFHELQLLEESNTLFIVTIRNPIDSVVSNYRINPSPIQNIHNFTKWLIHRYVEYIQFCENMKKEGRNVIFLRYEDFAENLDYLFDFIENHFSISIAEEDKALIRNGYGKENVYSSIEAFADFNGFLPISGFHGKHTTLEKYVPPEELLYWLNYYLPDVKPVYENYGYFQE